MTGFRTFLFSAAVAVLGALESLNWTSVVNEQTAGVVLIVIGAAVAVLRSVTRTAPGVAQ